MLSWKINAIIIQYLQKTNLSTMNAKQVLHNCGNSLQPHFFSLLLDDFLLNWMQKIPRSTRNRALHSSVWLPSVIMWNERIQSERAEPGIQMEVLFRQALFLPVPKEMHHSPLRPNTFLFSLQLHFQRKVFADWSMYFVSRARNPGRRN